MRIWLFAVVPVAAANVGCGVASSLEDRPTNNPEITVEKVADHDGCTIYRFKDAGYHWFVRCNNDAEVATMTTKSCGKGCLRDEVIPASTEPVKSSETARKDPE